MEEEKVESKEVSVSRELKLQKAQEKGRKILEKLLKARNKVSDRYSQHQENMAFYEGTQYELSRYRVARPWVVRMRTPYASVAIDTRVSSLTASDYRGKLIPYYPEDEDAIRAIDEFKNDEWERMNLDNKIDEAIKTSAIVREGYIHIRMVEKGKRMQMVADAIDMPSSVYIDPNALSLRDARHVFVVSRIDKAEVSERYPEFAWALSDEGRATRLSPEDRGEVYFTNDYMIEQDDTLTMIVLYEKKNGEIHKTISIEDVVVEEKVLDGLTKFPIAQMRWRKAAGSPYGLALMDDLREPQKAINAIESATVNTAVAYSAPSYGVRKGAGVDPKQLSVALGAPGMIVMVDGDPAQSIKPLNLPQLDSAIIGVRDSYIAAIDRVAGITDQYLGSIGTSGNTASGTKMALERAKIIEGDVLRNIEEFVEDITCIVVEYILATYQGEMVTSRQIDQASGEIRYNEREIPVVDELEYSFYVNLEKRTPYSIEREKEMLLELYQMQHQYGDKIKLINQLDILGAYDLSNRDILVERFKKLAEQSDAELAQLISQIIEMAKTVGIPDEAVQQAIMELLARKEQTPFTDELIQQMEQMAVEQAQMKQAQMEQFTQEAVEAGVPQDQIQQAQAQVMSQMQ